eukprot:COSAG01_NODE_940_length_12584_cov_7.454218_6_plen_253_part_00
MCRTGWPGPPGHRAKPKTHLMELRFGIGARHAPNITYDFDKMGLRQLVSCCVEEYFHDPWRVADDSDDDDDDDPVSQFWINEVETTSVSHRDGAVLDKPNLQRFLLHRLWACLNQPGGYERPAGYMTYGRIRCAPGLTRTDVGISLRLRGRRTTYCRMLGMGTKVTGLSRRHRPGGSRRGKLFYAEHGGFLYAPIKYHYGTGSFNLGRRLKDYDPATDTWTNGPGAANWTYSYLDAHQKQLHLKSGSWVPRD